MISASFESVLYNGNGATCCMMILAVAGLRLGSAYGLNQAATGSIGARE